MGVEISAGHTTFFIYQMAHSQQPTLPNSYSTSIVQKGAIIVWSYYSSLLKYPLQNEKLEADQRDGWRTYKIIYNKRYQ